MRNLAIVGIVLLVLGTGFFGLKRVIESEPEFALKDAQQETIRGQVTGFVLSHVVSIDWNKPSEYGELYLNVLVSSCNPWTPRCAEIAEILLRQGANINAISANKLGMAPLHAALGNVGAVQFLLQHGANPNQPAGGERFNGLTPIQVANQFKERPVDVINLLASKGGH